MSKRSRGFDSYPAPLKEALAVHEAFRKLGFSAEQIYIHRNPPPLLDIVVVLMHLDKSLTVTLGRLGDKRWKKKWTSLVHLFNSGGIPEDDFQRWYDRSFAGTHHVELLLMLQVKGISPPLGDN
jgi:hypothetical protein